MRQEAIIIGSGLGGLGAACLLGRAGYTVTVLEKNGQIGGRAGLLEDSGFRFDTGPSWYLMPDVFAHFFAALGERTEEYLALEKVTPGYRVFFKSLGEQLDITGDIARDAAIFETFEPGAGKRLQQYLQKAERTYALVTGSLLYKNYDGIRGVLQPDMLRTLLQMHPLRSLHAHVTRSFKDGRLQKVLEYPSVFLGVSPFRAPAFYSLLSHADMTQGVYYPRGGIYEIVRALEKICAKYDVQIHTGRPVEKIMVESGRAVSVMAGGEELRADVIVSDAGVEYTETQLLPAGAQDHSSAYWGSRSLAPSAFIMYLGLSRQYDSLAHHNLLFSSDWKGNFRQVSGASSGFPLDPSLYVCAPGKTDPTIAPPGCENLFVLVPVAAGVEYTDAQLRAFEATILETLERELRLPGLREHIIYRKTRCAHDFSVMFNSPGGTGLGLAHTLRQTAMFRPRNMSRKARGLYYVGADVHPGIGMPTALVSAELFMQRLRGDNGNMPFGSM